MKYLDTNVIIRLPEGDAATKTALQAKLTATGGGFMTSELSLLECRCHPMRAGNAQLLNLYDAFFASGDLRLCGVDRVVVDRATQIRATTSLRVPDAIHLATALTYGAAMFCSGDLHFAQIKSINVEIM